MKCPQTVFTYMTKIMFWHINQFLFSSFFFFSFLSPINRRLQFLFFFQEFMGKETEALTSLSGYGKEACSSGAGNPYSQCLKVLGPGVSPSRESSLAQSAIVF